MAVDLSRSFAVVVHDVAPAFAGPLDAILRVLAPRLGDRVSAAVVPSWRGVPLDPRADAGFLDCVATDFGEVLQHGLTHRQDRPGPVTFLSGGSNELTGLPLAEACARLEAGRAILGRCFRRPVVGFVPPAWRAGPIATTELARAGFAYLCGFGAVRPAAGPSIPLTTWSWDWGVVGRLGVLGEVVGETLSAIRPGALPCVVIHPADVGRGFLPRCLRVIDGLRREGRSPVLLSELLDPVAPEGPPCSARSTTSSTVEWRGGPDASPAASRPTSPGGPSCST